MYSDNPSNIMFKCVSGDLPNIFILTKNSKPGKVQVTFGRVTVGNKSLVETIADLTLAVSLEWPTVVSIETTRASSSAGDKIRLLIMEVLLCTTARDLA